MHWRLNRIQYPVYNLGPGRRMGIWVQGCTLKCDGCLSPDTWSQKGGKLVLVPQLANAIEMVADQFDGITVSGGEPFQQYSQLVAFCTYIKKKTQLNLFVFSGYYLEEIAKMYPDRAYEQCLDFLVDGRYVSDLHDESGQKGSQNQSVYTFEASGPRKLESIEVDQRWTLSISQEGTAYLSGIPKCDDLSRLDDYLRQSNLDMWFKRSK